MLLSVCMQAQLPLPFTHYTSDALVYDTSLDYGDRHLSGLMVVRYTEPGYHVLLISKVGFTLMEFIIHPDSMEWKKRLPGKQRKSALKAMEKDFRLLLLAPLYNPEKIKQKRSDYYVLKKNIRIGARVSTEIKRVNLAESKGFLNLFKSKVRFEYTAQNRIPETIVLNRCSLKFSIEMKKSEQ